MLLLLVWWKFECECFYQHFCLLREFWHTVLYGIALALAGSSCSQLLPLSQVTIERFWSWIQLQRESSIEDQGCSGRKLNVCCCDWFGYDMVRGERTRGVTSGARQEFCRNFFTMAKIGHRQFGVRNSPLLQLILCYYLLSRVKTLGRHRRGYGLCRPRVWSPQVLTLWRFSCKRHWFFWQNRPWQPVLVLLIDYQHINTGKIHVRWYYLPRMMYG